MKHVWLSLSLLLLNSITSSLHAATVTQPPQASAVHWIAVAGDRRSIPNNVFFGSTDGKLWAPLNVVGLANARGKVEDYANIQYGAGQWLVVPGLKYFEPPKMAYSTDGLQWTKTALSNDDFASKNSRDAALTQTWDYSSTAKLPISSVHAAFGGGKWIVGKEFALYASADASHWSRAYYRGMNNLRIANVSYSANKWLALGEIELFDKSPYQATALYLSDDGNNWRESQAFNSTFNNQHIIYNLRKAIYGPDGMMVVVGREQPSADVSRAVIYASADGKSWTKTYAEKFDEPSDIFDVDYGNGIYVAVGYRKDYGAMYTSTDGKHWIRRTFLTNVTLRAVAHNNGLWTVVGNNDKGVGVIYTSTDGKTWVTARIEGHPTTFWSVATDSSN